MMGEEMFNRERLAEAVAAYFGYSLDDLDAIEIKVLVRMKLVPTTVTLSLERSATLLPGDEG